jgi:mono/diheme cytochrome c family protein
MKRRRGFNRIGFVIGAAVAGAALLVLMLTRPWDSAPDADPADAAQVAIGESLYARHCAACHGARLEGQANWRRRKPDGRLPAPPHDAQGHTWHHADGQLSGVIKRGIGPPLVSPGYASDMQSFAGRLSDAEIWAVIAFIKSRWPEEIRRRQPRSERGAP